MPLTATGIYILGHLLSALRLDDFDSQPMSTFADFFGFLLFLGVRLYGASVKADQLTVPIN